MEITSLLELCFYLHLVKTDTLHTLRALGCVCVLLGAAAVTVFDARAQEASVVAFVRPDELARYMSARQRFKSAPDLLATVGGDEKLEYEKLRTLFANAKLPPFEILGRRKPGECPSCMPGGTPEPLAAPVPGGVGEGTALGTPALPAFLPNTPQEQVDDVTKRWNALYAGITEQHLNSVVRLVYANASRVCTGVLVAPDWVLTSGHCVAAKPTHVTVGRLYVSPHQFPVAAQGCFLHPQALGGAADRDFLPCGSGQNVNLFDRNHDLAMLRLAKPVPPVLARPAVMLGGVATSFLRQRFARLAGFGTEAYKPTNPSHVDPPLERLNGPAFLDVSEGYPGAVRVVSSTAAFVAAGDSGGPTFLACRDGAREAELLVGVNGHAYPGQRSADATAVFKPEHSAWIRRLASNTAGVDSSECVHVGAPDCSALDGDALVQCMLASP